MKPQFNFTSVTAKLIAVILLPTLFLGAISFWQMAQNNQAQLHSQDAVAARFKQLQSIRIITRAITFNIIDTGHKSRADMLLWTEAAQLLSEGRQLMTTEWAHLMNTQDPALQATLSPENQAYFADALSVIDNLQKFVQEQSSYDLGNYIDLELYTKLDPLLTLLEQMGSQENTWALADMQNTQTGLQQLNKIFYGLFLLSVIVVLVLGTLIIKAIRTPLRHVQDIMEKVSKNKDLTHRINLKKNDEFKIIGISFNAMLADIQQVFIEYSDAMVQMDKRATTLLGASQSNHDHALDTSKEVGSVAAAAEEMSQSSQSVQAHSHQTVKNTEIADGHANENFKMVQVITQDIRILSQAINASAEHIKTLCQHSQDIGGMLAIIRSVAEQTNLLALNAAIEAARAGEQGRGFAVVAEEVRNLAMRTQESTLQIEKIVSQIQEGTEKAAKNIQSNVDSAHLTAEKIASSENALNLMMASFNHILNDNTAIAASIQEQSLATQEVSAAIHKIQHHADQGESAANIALQKAAEITEHSQQLRKIIAQFKL